MRNIILVCLLLTASSTYAQLTKSCSGSGRSQNVDNTNTEQVAKSKFSRNFRGGKAWQDEFWYIYYQNNAGGATTLPKVVSPFWITNTNTDGLAKEANSDFKRENGWELVYANLGNDQTDDYKTNAAIIFYNKYTAVLRTFLYVSQVFSETGSDGAAVRLYFKGGTQSAALTHHKSVAKALDNFDKKIVMTAPNNFPSNTGNWLTADFPIAYDPCTCQFPTKFVVDAVVYNKGSVDIRIDPIKEDEKSKDKGFNAIGAIATSLTDPKGGDLAGAVKKFQDADKAKDELVKWAERLTGSELEIQISDELQELGDGVGDFTQFLSKVGPFSSAVVGLFDFFVNGGSKSGKSFQPVAIVNSMKATGNITFSSNKNENVVNNPGAIAGGTIRNQPEYKNIMGIMNLVETPVVEQTLTRTQGSGKSTWTKAVHQRLTTPIKYVVNPASGLRLKDIKAAFVYTGIRKESSSPYASNLIKEGKEYRTNYFSLGCLHNQYFVPVYLDKRPSVYFKFPLGETYLKIMAVFERIDEPEADDVLFAAKYEVKIKKEGINGAKQVAYFPTYYTNLLKDNNVLVNLEQDVVLENRSYSLSGETTAASMITVQNATINGAASLVAEEVTLNRNTIINPGISFYGNISDREGCRDAAPLCPSEIASFCNSSKYNPNAE